MRSDPRFRRRLLPRAACWLASAVLLGLGFGCGQPATVSPTRTQEGAPPPEHAAQETSRWADAIREFEAEDRASPPPKGAVLFVGSSSIRMWDLEASFPECETINRGFGGSQIADVLRYAPRIVLPYEPRAIVFYAGDNDIAGGKTAERVLRDFETFVLEVHADLPRTRIVFLAIKPSIARWSLVEEMRRANRFIEELARTDQRLAFVDLDAPMLGADGRPRPELFAEDGLHLNERGYELWTRLVEAHLDRTDER